MKRHEIERWDFSRPLAWCAIAFCLMLPIYALFSDAMVARDPLWTRLSMAGIAVLVSFPLILLAGLRQTWRLTLSANGAVEIVHQGYIGPVALKSTIGSVMVEESDLPLSIDGTRSRVALVTAGGRALWVRGIPVDAAKEIIKAVSLLRSAEDQHEPAGDVLG